MRTLLLICLTFALAGSLRAAEEATAPTQVVSLRVLSMDGMVTDLAVSSPEGRTRVVARPSAFSNAIRALAQNGFVTFFDRNRPAALLAAKDAEPEPPAAHFAVIPGVDRYLVILAATGTGAQRQFSAYAIPDPAGALPTRHARVVNFTHNPLAVRLGTSAAVVAASQSSVLPCPPGTDGHTSLQLARPNEQGDWELINSTRIAIPGNRRLLLLIAPEVPPALSADGIDIAASGVFSVRVVYDSEASAGSVSLDR